LILTWLTFMNYCSYQISFGVVISTSYAYCSIGWIGFVLSREF
jgi:hypothetical protein